ncbi:hypothetical protein HG263_21580 [Pseudoalteromonas sp. JBTF-M23]|uniref:Uncharacterized protein n=1 Tax=Pseudoalteromonas caenipelagi TaxID=2726988 RepID=A0A849VIG0_9GAMM|nr:hypothetical protein [Pseudoalteromonas caenipelagi]NOU53095.1 hypothetical protein [Pseudoalteromonas caenipelagi]
MPTVEQSVAQLQQTNAELVTASNELTNEVTSKLSTINSTVDAKMQEIDGSLNTAVTSLNDYLARARAEHPFYRLTKNQLGTVTSNVLDGYSVNGAFPIQFELYRVVQSGIAWELRDDEEKEILTAMGRARAVHFSPDINVVKMTWSGWQSSVSAPTFYQKSDKSTTLTCASYARLVSGSLGSAAAGFTGITNEWGLCGDVFSGSPGSYFHDHPYIASESGEILFFWYATVAGLVPLERNRPRWGHFPYIYDNQPL